MRKGRGRQMMILMLTTARGLEVGQECRSRTYSGVVILSPITGSREGQSGRVFGGHAQRLLTAGKQ